MALRLDWDDERYVRIYVRDTLDWSALSWDAQALYFQLNRKASRKGRVDLGRHGLRGVAVLLGRAELASRIEPALEELLSDGCVRLEGTVLVIDEFVEAQEAVSSGKKRAKDLRDRQREEDAERVRNETLRDANPSLSESLPPRRNGTSPNVTTGYSTAQTVRHSTERNGTPSPSRSRPAGSHPPPTRHGTTEADFAADLAAEDRQRAALLELIRECPLPVHEIAARTYRASDVAGVEEDLRALAKEGKVTVGPHGSPPVTCWRAA